MNIITDKQNEAIFPRKRYKVSLVHLQSSLYKTLAKPSAAPILQPLLCHQTTASRFESTN
jgi:hypothetical protein